MIPPDAPRDTSPREREAPGGSRSTVLAVGLAAAGIGAASILLTLYGSPPMRMRVPAPGGPGPTVAHAGVVPWVWAAGGLAAPLWSALARRLPLDRRRWLSSLGAHLAVILGVTLITSMLFFAVLGVPPQQAPVTLLQLLTWSTPLWLIAAVMHALQARDRSRRRGLEAVRLRAELAETRLQALSGQLRPHFLFNTLQGISTLLHRDPGAADRMLNSLGSLLRESLRADGCRDHSLGRELALLDEYMAICRQRFGDRLEFNADVDGELRDARVPPFSLQPLAENAIEHGVARSAGSGRVSAFARREGDELCYGISDDGPGVDGDAPSEGVGLGNTRRRLRELYGDRGRLELRGNGTGGLCAEIRIPFRATTMPPEPPR